MSRTPFARNFWIVLAVAVAVTVGFAVWLRSVVQLPAGGLKPGEQLPPIRAAGWINGRPPENLEGRVVVVDAWATWCGVCYQQAPEMIRLWERFHEEGVVFIGLTDDGEADLPYVQQFVDETGMPWPNGYGAVETIRELGAAEQRPGIWVADPTGRIVWNYGSPEPLEEAIERALAERS